MSLNLPRRLAEQIEQILSDLRREAEAECVLLADISGQLISVAGQLQEIDPVLVAALAAGDVAAMAELTRHIGEESRHSSFLHEGERKSIYLFSVASSFILIVIFWAGTPIGLVRLVGGRTAARLYALSAAFEELMHVPHETPSHDFRVALADELEKAFVDYHARHD
jgi:predicted regulator of Ras-like GTPase activity (Roadblock/LC7/MglB family)